MEEGKGREERGEGRGGGWKKRRKDDKWKKEGMTEGEGGRWRRKNGGGRRWHRGIGG